MKRLLVLSHFLGWPNTKFRTMNVAGAAPQVISLESNMFGAFMMIRLVGTLDIGVHVEKHGVHTGFVALNRRTVMRSPISEARRLAGVASSCMFSSRSNCMTFIQLYPECSGITDKMMKKGKLPTISIR